MAAHDAMLLLLLGAGAHLQVVSAYYGEALHRNHLPYHCQAGAYMSADKKAWCCEHRNLGCDSIDDFTYDCNAGWSNWRAGWSGHKKMWCCRHEHRGCDVAFTTRLPYDCDAGVANWRVGWSIGKKAWCCHSRNIGCQTAVIQPAPVPYDCNAGWSNWRAGWSVPKKAWCCQHENRGCFDAFTTRLPYDCNAGVANWRAGWSIGKKSWCCRAVNVGCGGGMHDFHYNCIAPMGTDKSLWSLHKRKWCCHHANVGCAGWILNDNLFEEPESKHGWLEAAQHGGSAQVLALTLIFLGCLSAIASLIVVARRWTRATPTSAASNFLETETVE